MKKVYKGFLLVMIFLVSVAIIVADTPKKYNSDIGSIDIIINRLWYDDEDKEQYSSNIYSIFPATLSFEETNINNLEGSCNILQLDNQRFGVVDKANNFLVVNNSGLIEKKISLDIMPEKMVVYNDSVLLYFEKMLYELNLTEEKVSVFYNFSVEVENLLSNAKIVVCSTQDKVYILGENIEEKVDTAYKCLGFLNESTLLFSKELYFGFIVFYDYDISNKNFNMAGWVCSAGGIHKATLSSDGEYLFYFASNGEGVLEPYLLNLNSNKKIKFNFKIDCINSIQWIHKTGDDSSNTGT